MKTGNYSGNILQKITARKDFLTSYVNHARILRCTILARDSILITLLIILFRRKYLVFFNCELITYIISLRFQS